mgnify:CR=1 FL=1
MGIQENWKKYENEAAFNFSFLPEEIQKKGRELTFQQKQFIVYRGDSIQYIYFIKSGSVLGTRSYADGNEYNYFLLTVKIIGCFWKHYAYRKQKEFFRKIDCKAAGKSIY